MTDFDRARQHQRGSRAATSKRARRAVVFNTREFLSAHGRTPRGHGSWAFIDAQLADREDYLAFVFWANGSYIEAKKAAAAHFAGQANFSGEVAVLP